MEMVKKVTEETNLITIKTRMERKGRERSQVVEMEVIAALVTALMTAQAQMELKMTAVETKTGSPKRKGVSLYRQLIL